MKAVLDRAEWLGAVAGTEVGEVGTGLGEDLAVGFVVLVVVVVMIDLG